MKNAPHLVGIDVSARTLRVAIEDVRWQPQSLEFPQYRERPSPIEPTIDQGEAVGSVALEANGIYSFDLLWRYTARRGSR